MKKTLFLLFVFAMSAFAADRIRPKIGVNYVVSEQWLTNTFPVNVKDFGALGDGTTDDTVSISNAVTYARTNLRPLMYPPGTYKQSAILLNNVRVTGYGATIFQISIADVAGNYGDNGDPSVSPKWSPAFLITRATNVTIEGFKFTQAPTAQFFGGVQTAITAIWSENVEIHHCEFAQTNNWIAINLSGVKKVNVHNNNFNNNDFSAGQAILSTGIVIGETVYDTSRQRGQEQITLRQNYFTGTNSAVRARVFLSGTVDCVVEENTFENVQSPDSIISAYVGDFGLHHYNTNFSTNAVWVIQKNRVIGTNNYWNGFQSGVVKLKGHSGNVVVGFPDSYEPSTGYGTVVRDNWVEDGNGITAFDVAISGALVENNIVNANTAFITAQVGISRDCTFRLNKFTKSRNFKTGAFLAVAVNSSASTTNSNWALERNSFTGAEKDSTMFWQSVHIWENLTLRGNEWHDYSTNAPSGSFDALWRISVSETFRMENEKIFLHGTVYDDAAVFDITQTAGVKPTFKGVQIIPSNTALKVFGGAFTFTTASFEDCDLGAAYFRFFTRGSILNSRFVSKSISRAIVQFDDTLDANFSSCSVTQSVASTLPAVWRIGTEGNIRSIGNTISASSTNAAVVAATGVIYLENGSVANAGAGGLYSGAVTLVTRAPYPMSVYRKLGGGSFNLNINNSWVGTSDIQLVPITDEGRSGGLAAYHTNNSTAGLQFSFGYNPILQRLEVGTNTAAIPFHVSKDGAVTALSVSTPTITGTPAITTPTITTPTFSQTINSAFVAGTVGTWSMGLFSNPSSTSDAAIGMRAAVGGQTVGGLAWQRNSNASDEGWPHLMGATGGVYTDILRGDSSMRAVMPQGVVVGGGTAIGKILRNTAALNFGSIATLSSEDLTITVTGATVGNSVAIGLPAAPTAGITFGAFVSATDTVTIRAHNYTAGSIDPASATYGATVFVY